MFSGTLHLKNHLWFKYVNYKFIRIMNLWNTSAIYGQLSQVQTRTHVLVIPAFILGHRSKPLQPVCRELNSDQFAFFKTYSSCSRTHSSSVSNSGTLFILARLNDPDPWRKLKNMRTYYDMDFENRPILYCFRKTPSKFAFFCWKMSKYDHFFL